MVIKKRTARPTVRRRTKEEQASKAPYRNETREHSSKPEGRKAWRQPEADRRGGQRKPERRDRPQRPEAGRRERSQEPRRERSQEPRRERSQEPRRERAEQPSADEKWSRLARASTGPGGYLRHGDIPAHKLGRQLRNRLYDLCKDLDPSEHDNLTARLKQAATTVTAALATGFGEGSFAAAVQRSLESRGALVAIQDHLEQLEDLELLAADVRQALKEQVDLVIAAVNEYMGACAKAHR